MEKVCGRLFCHLYAIGKTRLTGNHHFVAVVHTGKKLIGIAKTLAELNLVVGHVSIFVDIYVVVA